MNILFIGIDDIQFIFCVAKILLYYSRYFKSGRSENRSVTSHGSLWWSKDIYSLMTGCVGTSVTMSWILLSHLYEEVGENVWMWHTKYHSTVQMWNPFAGALLAEGNASTAHLKSQCSGVFQNYSEAAMQTPGCRGREGELHYFVAPRG